MNLKNRKSETTSFTHFAVDGIQITEPESPTKNDKIYQEELFCFI